MHDGSGLRKRQAAKLALKRKRATSKVTRPPVRVGVVPPSRRPKNGKGAKPPARKPKARAQRTDVGDALVLIDDRAGSKQLIDYPPFNRCGQLCRLGSADVCFIGNGPDGEVTVGIELKSVFDLISSMDNGRVQATQIPAMLDEYNVLWLVYYGLYRPSPDDNSLQVWRKGGWRNHYIGKRAVPYGLLEGFDVEMQEIGVNTKRVADIAEAAAFIAEVVRWRTKPWGKHKLLRALDQSRKVGREDKRKNKEANRASLMPTLDDRTLFKARVANQFPCLGYERAVVAAEHFDTVTDMVLASSDEWAELETRDRVSKKPKRFGKVVGDAIVRAVNW